MEEKADPNMKLLIFKASLFYQDISNAKIFITRYLKLMDVFHKYKVIYEILFDLIIL